MPPFTRRPGPGRPRLRRYGRGRGWRKPLLTAYSRPRSCHGMPTRPAPRHGGYNDSGSNGHLQLAAGLSPPPISRICAARSPTLTACLRLAAGLPPSPALHAPARSRQGERIGLGWRHGGLWRHGSIRPPSAGQGPGGARRRARRPGAAAPAAPRSPRSPRSPLPIPHPLPPACTPARPPAGRPVSINGPLPPSRWVDSGGRPAQKMQAGGGGGGVRIAPGSPVHFPIVSRACDGRFRGGPAAALSTSTSPSYPARATADSEAARQRPCPLPPPPCLSHAPPPCGRVCPRRPGTVFNGRRARGDP